MYFRYYINFNNVLSIAGELVAPCLSGSGAGWMDRGPGGWLPWQAAGGSAGVEDTCQVRSNFSAFKQEALWQRKFISVVLRSAREMLMAIADVKWMLV